jgi:predicted dienelactone hydrolase
LLLNRRTRIPARILGCLAGLWANAAWASVGFQTASVPQPGGPALHAGFWYPSRGTASPMPLGFYTQTVAQNAPVDGNHLPLIVISPGTLGNWQSDADLALALANAGFVVASMTPDEFGPNFVLKPDDRTRQFIHLIDFAASAWPGHDHLDMSRVGAFGFSLGGFTVLVAIGGKPNVALIPLHCVEAPTEFSCTMRAKHALELVQQNLPPSAWVSDPRIKAAVIAAPALGYLFGRQGLITVHIPVQLWRAGQDSVLAEPWNAEAVAQDLPVKPELHVVEGADHGDFSGLCSPDIERANPKLCTSSTGFDRRAFHARFNAAIVRFFKKTLPPPGRRPSPAFRPAALHAAQAPRLVH